MLINLQAFQVLQKKYHVHRTLWFACSMHCLIRTFGNMTLRPLDFIFGHYFVCGESECFFTISLMCLKISFAEDLVGHIRRIAKSDC